MTDETRARVNAVCANDETARNLYADICAQFEETTGRPPNATDQVQMLDYVRLEQLKDRANADIAKRGLGRMESNGRQSYWKDNKSAVLILKYMDQQKKILKGLGIGGAGSMIETETIEAEDDFDSI